MPTAKKRWGKSLRPILKDKAAGRDAGFAAAFAAAPGAALYALLGGSGRTFSVLTLVFMLAGAVAEVSVFFSDFALLPILPTGLYIAGFALALNATLPSVSDIWNGVNFIGGDAYAGITFSCIFMVCALAGIVSCFLPQRKPID